MENIINKLNNNISPVKKKFIVVPACILILYAAAGIFAPAISPHSPYELSIGNRLLHPLSVKTDDRISILGTDSLGRDFFSRIMYGAMISFRVTFFISIINMIIGSTIGITSGYFGGWIDNVLMRITDMGISIPWIVVVFFVAAIIGPSYATVIISMTLFGWSNLARTLRIETLRLKNADFVLQAHISGCSVSRTIFKHILPNLRNVIIIITTMSVPYIILSEGILSFLSIGIPTINPSWGTLINEGRSYIYSAWWIPLLPAIAIFLVVYSSMYLGDWLQERLDPDV